MNLGDVCKLVNVSYIISLPGINEVRVRPEV